MVALILWGCTSPDDTGSRDPITVELLTERTQALVDLGPRVVGTSSEEDARALLDGWFLSTGLQEVESEPFAWDAWQRGASSLNQGGVEYATWAWSPSPSGTVSGVLESVEGDVGGKIALSRSGSMMRTEAFVSALTGGAVGLVHVSEAIDADGTDLVEVGHTLDGSSLPAVALGKRDGNDLELGEEITLSIDSSVLYDHTSYNVVGRVPGTGSGRVYVVAHYDSWDPSESAFDNAMGAAALSLLAERMAQEQPRREVVFIATSGEEQGLQGAQAYVEDHLDEVLAGTSVMTLDVLWSASGDYYVAATREEDRVVGMEAALDEGLPARDSGNPSPASDHFAFESRGLDSFWATRQPDIHYHTTHDRLEYLDMDDATAALRTQWVVLQELADL
ncbi:MAG TPA: M28 family peptidase [Myxococcota bacterium]|nr:M28 family peptidase [Myxococcota bacterium]